MSETVDRLRNMVACQCGETGGVWQSWKEANKAANIACLEDSCILHRCMRCNFHIWPLQLHVPFILTLSFPVLLACGCGGDGDRICQTFEDVLRVFSNFHFDSIRTEGFCTVCNYVCWEALPNVPSIVLPKLENTRSKLFLEVKKSTGVIVRARGRIIERVED